MSAPVVVIDLPTLREMIEDAVRKVTRERDAVPDWLDTDGVAQLVQLHPDTVARMARHGRLPAHRVGREYRFERAAIVAWMADRTARR